MGSVVSMHLTILLDNNRNPEKKSANGLAGWLAGWLAGSRELSYIYIKDKPLARLARVLFGFASIERASWRASERESTLAHRCRSELPRRVREPIMVLNCHLDVAGGVPDRF